MLLWNMVSAIDEHIALHSYFCVFFSGLHAINLFDVSRNAYKMYFWCAVWALYQYTHLPNEMCKSTGFQIMFLEEIGRTWFRNFQLSRNVLILSASDKQNIFYLVLKEMSRAPVDVVSGSGGAEGRQLQVEDDIFLNHCYLILK